MAAGLSATLNNVQAKLLATSTLEGLQRTFGAHEDTSKYSRGLNRLIDSLKGRTQQQAEEFVKNTLTPLVDLVKQAVNGSVHKDSASLRSAIPLIATGIAAELEVARQIPEVRSKLPSWFGTEHAAEAFRQIFTERIKGAKSNDSAAEIGITAGFLVETSIASAEVLKRIKPFVLGESSERLGSGSLFLVPPTVGDLRSNATSVAEVVRVVPATAPASTIELVTKFCVERMHNMRLLNSSLTPSPFKDQIFDLRFKDHHRTAQCGIRVTFFGSKYMAQRLENTIHYGASFCRDPEVAQRCKSDGRTSFDAFGSIADVAGMPKLNNSIQTQLSNLQSKIRDNDTGLLGIISYKFSRPDYSVYSSSAFGRVFDGIREFVRRNFTEFFAGGFHLKREPRENLTISFNPPSELEEISPAHARISKHGDFGIQVNINMPSTTARELRQQISREGVEAVFYDLLNEGKGDVDRMPIGADLLAWLREGLLTPLVPGYVQKMRSSNPNVAQELWRKAHESERRTAFARYVVCNLDSEQSVQHFHSVVRKASDAVYRPEEVAQSG